MTSHISEAHRAATEGSFQGIACSLPVRDIDTVIKAVGDFCMFRERFSWYFCPETTSQPIMRGKKQRHPTDPGKKASTVCLTSCNHSFLCPSELMTMILNIFR
jgi:hypothetical protein